MAQDVPVLASENIHRLLELGNRLDERVKSIQERQLTIDRRLEEVSDRQLGLVQRITVLESRGVQEICENLDTVKIETDRIEKRLLALEGDNGRNNDRWKYMSNFFVQLIWVILASYLLLKLNLQSPALP